MAKNGQNWRKWRKWPKMARCTLISETCKRVRDVTALIYSYRSLTVVYRGQIWPRKSPEFRGILGSQIGPILGVIFGAIFGHFVDTSTKWSFSEGFWKCRKKGSKLKECAPSALFWIWSKTANRACLHKSCSFRSFVFVSCISFVAQVEPHLSWEGAV